MHSQLFRQQALEHQKERLHGVVLILPKPSHLAMTGMILIWLIALFSWAISSQYARQVSVLGWLQPPDGIARIFAESGAGRVQTLWVSEGQLVSAGQPLMLVRAQRELANGASLEKQIEKEYQQQQQWLSARILEQHDLHRIQSDKVNHQIHMAEQEVTGIGDQIETLKARQILLDKRIARYEEMRQQGHLAVNELESLTDQKLTMQGQLQQLVREQIKQQDLHQQLLSQRQQLPQIQSAQINELRTQQSELALKLAQLQGQTAYVVVAAREGIVSNLQISVGQQVNERAPLLSIVPQHQRLQAKLLIPVRSAGFVEVGQTLDIRYDAFPFQKFGIHSGQVTHIAQDVSLPGEVSQSPMTLNEPVYVVTATLNGHQIQAYGRDIALKPGMTFSADIQLSQRSVLEWFFEPLLSITGRI
jgi:membrane fusion protein